MYETMIVVVGGFEERNKTLTGHAIGMRQSVSVTCSLWVGVV